MSCDNGAFMLLCRCLSSKVCTRAVADLRRNLAAGGVDWLGVAALANRHLVTPVLHEALRRKGLLGSLPDDFRLYLAEIHRRNVARNAAIRRQAGEAIAALNAADVIPLVLKGGAGLFEDAPGNGASIVGDLDLMVRRPDFACAEAVLRDLGYESVDDHEGRSHARTFARAGVLAAIDLHRDVGRQRLLVPADEAWRAAAPLPAGALRAAVLCPTHSVLLGIFHAQVHERNHARGKIPLRRLHDFTVAVGRHGAAVDWDAVDAAMRGLRLGHVLQAWLHLADRLLGMPPPCPAATWRARLHLRRCLFQLRHSRLASPLRVCSSVTGPFARVNIDYVYGGGHGPLRRNAHRLGHGLALLKKHRWGLCIRAWNRAMRGIRGTGP